LLQGKYRERDLYYIAEKLIKAGTDRNMALETLSILAKGCTPPYPEIERLALVENILFRVYSKERNLSGDLHDWVMQQDGNFSVTSCYKEQHIATKEHKSAVRMALHRMVKDGILEKHSNRSGVYRRVNAKAEKIDYMKDIDKKIGLLWPFEIEEYVYITPKSIVVIAGSPNTGKTAFVLNLIEMNMSNLDCHYFCSEMGDVELRNRLEKFERPIESWNFEAYERSDDFSDVIHKDSINIIDYLEIHDEFWKIGAVIKQIYDKLDSGIAVICLQKDPRKEYGLGGVRSLEKARLYLTMDSNKLTIVKGKNWVDSHINPNGLYLEFKLIQGCQFILSKGWMSDKKPIFGDKEPF